MKRILFLLALMFIASAANAASRKAIVDKASGMVINVIIADDGFPAPVGHVLIDGSNAGIGDTWDGVNFVKPPPPPPAPPISNADRTASEIQGDLTLKAIVKALAKKLGLTEQQLLDAIKSEVP